MEMLTEAAKRLEQSLPHVGSTTVESQSFSSKTDCACGDGQGWVKVGCGVVSCACQLERRLDGNCRCGIGRRGSKTSATKSRPQ